jgi:hypothetical protein
VKLTDKQRAHLDELLRDRPQWFKEKILADIAAEERQDDDEDTPRAGLSAYSWQDCVTVIKVNLCDYTILPRKHSIQKFDSTWNTVEAGASRLFRLIRRPVAYDQVLPRPT